MARPDWCVVGIALACCAAMAGCAAWESLTSQLLGGDTTGIQSPVEPDVLGGLRSGVVSTVARRDVRTVVAGTEAQGLEVLEPRGVTSDGKGGYFLSASEQIIWVDQFGRAKTVAGTGVPGFAGDHGPAVEAQLDSPAGLVLDTRGNLYVADQGNGLVRRVDSSGTISTYPWPGAEFFSPVGLVIDSRWNLFVAEVGDVKRVNESGTLIEALAPKGSGFEPGIRHFGSLGGLALDVEERLLVSEPFQGRVWLASADGTVTTFAGDGTRGFSGDGMAATAAQLEFPTGLTTDASGSVYVADNHRIRKVDSSGLIHTVAGSGLVGFGGDGGFAIEAALDAPRGLSVDSFGGLLIADTGNHRVRRVDLEGRIRTVAGIGAPALQLVSPAKIAMHRTQALLIVDSAGNKVMQLDPAGVLSVFAGNGSSGFAGDGGPATNARLRAPGGIAADGAGNVYIADSGNNRIRKVNPAGHISTIAGTGVAGFEGDGRQAIHAKLANPMAVAVDDDGSLYIADTDNLRVRRIDPTGRISTFAGNGGYGSIEDGSDANASPVVYPAHLAIGSQRTVFIGMDGAGQIARVNQHGKITMISRIKFPYSGDGGPAKEAGFDGLRDLTVDRFGNLLLIDRHRIRLIDTKGVIQTVAGGTLKGYSRDGGRAYEGRFSRPSGLALDTAGNLYVSDSGNHAVRKITRSSDLLTASLRE